MLDLIYDIAISLNGSRPTRATWVLLAVTLVLACLGLIFLSLLQSVGLACGCWSAALFTFILTLGSMQPRNKSR
ncbi:MAG: hypothetical protein AAF916_10090 [Planctomycetota bacterium]